MQIGAAISYSLFGSFGAAGTSGLRMLIAAVIMLAVFRPRLRGRSRAEWTAIVLYGVAMAAMNMLLYQAIARLPLGVATTLDFLGPCLVAFFASRRLREGLLAITAFVGVILMVGLGGDFDPIGIVWGVLAGASFAGYTLLAAKVGGSGGGLQSVALSIGVAAILTLPFSAPMIPLATLPQWGLLALSALVGTALAFSVDTIAGKLTSARVLGVFFAFDPVLGTIVGVLFLGQTLTPIALLGIVLVVLAGAGIVWFAGQDRARGEAAHGEAADGGAVGDPVNADPASGYPVIVQQNTPTAGRESVEIERKYEVPVGAELPDAEAFAAVGLRRGIEEVHELHACYYDTADGALGRARAAMRVREGGSDAGWHLKLKGDRGTRELHWPLAADIPAGLRDEMRALIGDAADRVAPLAELLTERHTVRLEDRNGVEVIELADDRVRARQLSALGVSDASGVSDARGAGDAGGTVAVDRAWREWEAELLPGAPEAVLDAAEIALLAAGATPSLSSAKIARATGALAALAQAKGASPEVVAALQEMDSSDREAARRLDA